MRLYVKCILPDNVIYHRLQKIGIGVVKPVTTRTSRVGHFVGIKIFLKGLKTFELLLAGRWRVGFQLKIDDDQSRRTPRSIKCFDRNADSARWRWCFHADTRHGRLRDAVSYMNRTSFKIDLRRHTPNHR